MIVAHRAGHSSRVTSVDMSTPGYFRQVVVGPEPRLVKQLYCITLYRFERRSMSDATLQKVVDHFMDENKQRIVKFLSKGQVDIPPTGPAT